MISKYDNGTAQPNLSAADLAKFLVPVPPLEEQHRIVAKVDELMRLCDALECRVKDGIKAHHALLEILLATLADSHSAEELSWNWGRLEANFDTLFTTEASVDELEQAIYELAIQGLLVKQYPEEEPASEFLMRNNPNWRSIRHAKGQLAFRAPLPAGWATCRFGDLGPVTGGGTPSKSNKVFWNGDIPWVSPKDMKVDYIDDAIDKITSEAIENSPAKLIDPGNLLIVVRGMILAHSFPVAITTAPVAINQDMKAIGLGGFDQAYVLILMKGLKRKILSLVERSTHGTCKLVSSKLWAMELPIPPRSEQTRIVERVSELSKICTQLRELICDADTASRHLADSTPKIFH